MKYKELERMAVRSLYTIRKVGVSTVIERESLIYNRTDRIIIDETRENKITISMMASNPNDFEILTSALAYAETPLGERQEEKKYYLRHRFLIEEGGCNYLNYDHSLQELNLSDKGQSRKIQTQFTQAEIEEIKEKYKTDLKDFEIDEVEE